MGNTKMGRAIRYFNRKNRCRRLWVIGIAAFLGVISSSCAAEISETELVAGTPAAGVVEPLPTHTPGSETSKPTVTPTSTSTPEPEPTPSPVPTVSMSVEDAERSPVGRAMRANVSSVDTDENGDWVAYDMSGNLIMRAKKNVEGEIGYGQWNPWAIEVNAANMTNVEGRVYILNQAGVPSYTGITLEDGWSLDDAGGMAKITDAEGFELFTYYAEDSRWVEVIYYPEVVLPVNDQRVRKSQIRTSLELNDNPELRAEIEQRNNFGNGGLMDLSDYMDNPLVNDFFRAVIPDNTNESGPVALLHTFVRNIHYGDFTELFDGVNVRSLIELEFIVEGENVIIFVPGMYVMIDHFFVFEGGWGPGIGYTGREEQEQVVWTDAGVESWMENFLPGVMVQLGIVSKEKTHETGVYGRNAWDLEEDILSNITSRSESAVEGFMISGDPDLITEPNGTVVTPIITTKFLDLE